MQRSCQIPTCNGVLEIQIFMKAVIYVTSNKYEPGWMQILGITLYVNVLILSHEAR